MSDAVKTDTNHVESTKIDTTRNSQEPEINILDVQEKAKVLLQNKDQACKLMDSDIDKAILLFIQSRKEANHLISLFGDYNAKPPTEKEHIDTLKSLLILRIILANFESICYTNLKLWEKSIELDETILAEYNSHWIESLSRLVENCTRLEKKQPTSNFIHLARAHHYVRIISSEFTAEEIKKHAAKSLESFKRLNREIRDYGTIDPNNSGNKYNYYAIAFFILLASVVYYMIKERFKKISDAASLDLDLNLLNNGR